MNENSLSRLLLLSAIPAILLMAFLFDYGALAIQQQNAQGAGLEPLLVVLYPIFELLIVTGVLGLFWTLMQPAMKQRLAVWVMAAVGLLTLYATPLIFFLPVPMTWYTAVDFLRPGTFVFQAGAMMGGAALLSMLLKQDHPAPAVQANADLVDPAPDAPGSENEA